jgi:predicted nucleic-acid-binding protein
MMLCFVNWHGCFGASTASNETPAAKLDKVLSTWTFVFADPEKFSAAIADYRDGRGDFADYLIGRRNAAAGCDHTVTFDKDLAAHPAFVVL